ncbi:tautomerase family protein [Streptomyces asiaticus]
MSEIRWTGSALSVQYSHTPFIRATISDPQLDSATQEILVRGLTDLAVNTLKKLVERTTVHLNLVPADRYYVGGEPVGEVTGAHVALSPRPSGGPVAGA